MSVLDTKHKRKSAIITSAILAVLVFAILNYGMKYLDPPLEYGIAINYGTSNVGKGTPKELPKVKQTTPKKEEQVEKVEEEVVKEVPKEILKEEVITQDTKVDVPVVEKPKKKEKKEEPKKEIKKEEKPKPKPKKPSKATLDAFNNLLKGDKVDGKTKGEGDDNIDGVKGKKDGDPKSSKYYGNKGGENGDPNYNLAGRNATSKPIEKPDCQEEGIVVVSVEVDQSGKVVRATPGVKGTTNTAPCLLKPAKEAALRTKWNADTSAPSKQRGTIIYKFTLTQ